MTHDEHELLARIDERTKSLQDDMSSVKATLSNNYITRAEFDPVKRVVYGGVGLVLVAVLGALIALVVVGRG